MINSIRSCICLAIAATAIVALTGCSTTAAYQLMGPVKTKKPITFHSDQTAILYWDYGKITGTFAQNSKAEAFGVVGMVVDAAIQSDLEKSQTNEYFLKYGKAEQVIFMTSLRDILQNTGAFKSVSINVAPKALVNGQVLISIDFKNSTVLSADEGYPITLNVALNIYGANGKEFTKNFTIKREASFFGGMFSEFKDAQTDVSQQLMSDVIDAINTWYAKSHPS